MEKTSDWKKTCFQFLSAQTISLFGSSIVQYAIIWYITLQTSSGIMMSIATLCGYLPQILISLFAGVWVDRYNRKVLIMVSDTIIAISTLVAAILFLSGHQSVYILFVVLLIRSAGTGIQTPAVCAILPQIVPKEHLMKANGINSSLNSISMFLSPVLSGMILSILSIEMTFFIDIGTALVANIIMFFLHVHSIRDKEDLLAMKENLLTGLRYVKQHATIKYQLLFLLLVFLFISPAAFLTPLLVTRSFGAEIFYLSISEMIFSLGAVAGGLLIATWGGFHNRMHTILVATVFYGLMMLGLGSSSIFIIYLIFNFLIGISMPCFNTPVTVMIQETIEPKMQGRIFSILQIVSSCALPLGTLLFGPLADWIPVQYIFIVCGCIVVGIAFGFYLISKKSKKA